jgi:hypothetical protein
VKFSQLFWGKFRVLSGKYLGQLFLGKLQCRVNVSLRWSWHQRELNLAGAVLPFVGGVNIKMEVNLHADLNRDRHPVLHRWLEFPLLDRFDGLLVQT